MSIQTPAAASRVGADFAHVTRVDLGCGAPEERCHGCFGVDINANYSPDLVWDCDQGLPFADDSLDFVNSDNALEHLRHPNFVIAECFRCLGPGGRARLVVPNVQYLPTLLLAFVRDIDGYFYWYMRLPHKRERSVHQALFTPHLFERMVREAGFRILRRGGWLWSKEVEVEAEKPAPESPG